MKIKKILLITIILLILTLTVTTISATNNQNITKQIEKNDKTVITEPTKNITTKEITTTNTKKNTQKYVNNYDELKDTIENIDNNENYEIELNQGDYSITDTIEASTNTSIIINGNNQTIKAKNNKKFLIVGEEQKVIIKNINIINTNSLTGGAIENFGNLTISNSKITDNNATQGGAIYNSGNLILDNSQLENNTVTDNGGAIYNTGKLIITNTILNNNTAKIGGALYNTGNLTISSSLLNNNTASIGGAVYSSNESTNYVINNDFINISSTHETLVLNGNKTLNNNTFLNCTITFEKLDITTKNDYIKITDSLPVYISAKLKYPNSYDLDILNRTIYSIYIDNTIKNITTNPNEFSITPDKIGNNTIFITPTISRDTKSNLKTIHINKLNTSLILSTINSTTTTNLTVISIIKDEKENILREGIINYYNDENKLIGTSYIINGFSKFNITYTQPGDYTIKAIYPETDNYQSCSSTITTTIKQTDINMNITPIYGTTTTNTTFIIITSDPNNETIKQGILNIINKNNTITTQTITDNRTIISTLLTEYGTYNITIEYIDPNNKYTQKEYTFPVTINKTKTQIITENNITQYIYKNLTINATIIDENNKTITEGNVTFYIDDKIIKQIDLRKDIAEVTTNITQDGIYIITTIYSGSDKYKNSTITSNLTIIGKINTTIIINPIKANYDDIIQITANITSPYDNCISLGKVVFKANNETLKDENNNILYTNVTNGTAYINYKIPSSWLKENITLEAVYSGNNNMYNGSRSIAIHPEIFKRNTILTLETSHKSIANENITFTTIIKDNITNNFVNNGQCCFKINGITIKDSNGKTIIVNVTNGIAQLNYTIPDGTSAHNYTITTVFSHPGYNREETKSIQEITKINVNTTITEFVQNGSNIKIMGNIHDTNGHTVIGITKISLKVNGKTIINSTGGSIFYITNGTINSTIHTQFRDTTIFKNLTIITSERNGYKSNSNKINII